MNDHTQPTSRDIPRPIQREVRQRCGFGCVICGLPLYEYEHMEGWADVQRHVAGEITLLCDQHHREKTGGLLPLEHVIEANDAPYNLRTGVSKPYDLHYEGTECEIEIGGNRFTAQLADGNMVAPIVIDQVTPFNFFLEDGHLLLNVAFFDERNHPILEINRNQLVYSMEPWDIQLVGRNLILRAGHGQISLDMTFEPPQAIRVQRGRLLLNGVEVIVRPEYVLIVNNRTFLRANAMSNVSVGIAIGHLPPGIPAAIKADALRRPQDSEEAQRWAEEQLRASRQIEGQLGLDPDVPGAQDLC
jgi:hypothetical protein